MRILLLGPYPSRIAEAFAGDELVATAERIDQVAAREFDWLISYGYRHIISPRVLELFSGRAINLHIAYLPWNRGAHPNYWSWVEGTPKGVSIHRLDEGIDTGAILLRECVELDATSTFRETYDSLMAAMDAAFLAAWPAIRADAVAPEPQTGAGSFHRAMECPLVPLRNGWDTVIAEHLADITHLGRAVPCGRS